MNTRKVLLIGALLGLFISSASAQRGGPTRAGAIMFNLSSDFDLSPNNGSLSSFYFLTATNKADNVENFEGEPQKALGLGLSPKVGYFVADNFAVGLDLAVNYQ